MKLGVNALIWTTKFDSSFYPILPSIREHGFDCFELPVFNPSEIAAGELKAEFENNGLECTVCSILPSGMNPISHDADVRKKTIAHLVACIEVTAKLGAKLIAGPLYAPVGYLVGRRRSEDEWNWAVECFKALGPVLDSNDVTLALEPLNRFETFFLTTSADVRDFVDAVGHPRVGAMLDTFHTNIEEKDVAGAFRLLGGRLKHMHASENDRGIPGTGHVDFPAIVSALGEIGYDGCMTIESFGFWQSELSSAAAIWRDLAPTPDSIAFEGVRYLRRVLETNAVTRA